ncbi:MAG: hypothetical protein JWP09_546 [Candidatus Taylorbacteria bacterium]|nr:hypothetical protein [Candidatus Taylorbacteria bacterium]
MNRNAIYAIIIIIFAFLGILTLSKIPAKPITTYEECTAAGYPALESYPEQCKTPDGKTFVKSVQGPSTTNNDADLSDLIVIDSPKSNDTIKSPVTITGRARGSFYFEGSLPVKLLDSAGKVIAEAPAKAQSDWMTSEFVPFKVTLNYTEPTAATSATLSFHNDNPSGLPKNDKEYKMAIILAPSAITGFNIPFPLNIGDKVSFSDTLTVTLKSVEDSRCKPNVQCIWAGELSPILLVGKAQSEVRLGTATKKSVTFGNYTFTLTDATATTATIIVKKNNPPTVSQGACYVGGCSSEVCSDQKGIVSTCIYREEYACYKTATCERQTNGNCGWTETTALTTCINNAK